MSPQGAVLAHWWKRVVAAIIDGAILTIPSYIIVALFGIGFSSNATIDPVTGELEGGSGFIAGFLVMFAVLFLVGVAYQVILNGGPRGQTVGKMVMKIQVRDEATGGPIGYGKAFIRWIVALLLQAACYVPGIVDVLFPLWDPKRQTIHDKAANSLVIDLNP